MNTPVKVINNEKGFVLITSLLILVVVMIIGIAATNTSILEIQISGNDRVTKESFYAAEGGLHVGAELIEQSISDFLEGAVIEEDPDGGVDMVKFGNLVILQGDYTQLYMNPRTDPPENIDLSSPDVRFSYAESNPIQTTIPRTELWMGGQGVVTPGSALQQLAGYEGAGKGIGGGGGARLYDIHSVTHGRNNSEAWLLIQWLHAL